MQSCGFAKGAAAATFITELEVMNIQWYGVGTFIEPLTKTLKFIKRETLTQVFFWEFCEIFNNTVLCRTPQVAASALRL